MGVSSVLPETQIIVKIETLKTIKNKKISVCV